MAIIPAILYYLSIVLMIEADARRLGTRAVDVDVPSVGELTRRGGYQFLPPHLDHRAPGDRHDAVPRGVPVDAARRRPQLPAEGERAAARAGSWPPSRRGGRGVLSVAATTATAGIIVGVS